MAWGKIDDGLHKSVKWRRTNKGGQALWTTALSWCMDEMNDGRVPSDLLAYLGGRRADAQSLVASGLWHETDDGWEFHDWLDHQPSRAEIEHKREQQRERKRRWAESQNATPVTQKERVTTASGNATTDPTRPDPTPKEVSHLENKGGSKQREDKHPPQPCGRSHDTATPCGACGLARKSAKDDDTAAAKARSQAKSSAAKAQAAETHRKITACDDCDEKGYTSGRKVCHHQYTKEEA